MDTTQIQLDRPDNETPYQLADTLMLAFNAAETAYRADVGGQISAPTLELKSRTTNIAYSLDPVTGKMVLRLDKVAMPAAMLFMSIMRTLEDVTRTLAQIGYCAGVPHDKALRLQYTTGGDTIVRLDPVWADWGEIDAFTLKPK